MRCTRMTKYKVGRGGDELNFLGEHWALNEETNVSGRWREQFPDEAKGLPSDTSKYFLNTEIKKYWHALYQDN